MHENVSWHTTEHHQPPPQKRYTYAVVFQTTLNMSSKEKEKEEEDERSMNCIRLVGEIF